MIKEPPALTVKSNRRRPSDAQIAAFQGTPTGFVVDALFGDGALASDIKPIGEGRDIDCVAAGPALTAECGPADILATMAALNFVQPGDILVSSVGGHQGCAAAGDRAMGMLKNCGAAGFVTDGPMRDYAGLVDVGLPVWCSGLNPGSPFTLGPAKVGLPLQLGGQQVETGDMIVADRDGVVVVPFDRIDEVVERLETIRALETELDGKVAEGLRVPQSILDLLESDAVIFVD